MTVLEKKGHAGIGLPRVGRVLIAAAIVIVLVIGVAMAVNPKVEPATQIEQEQTGAPFLADTDTPSHKGRNSPIGSTLGPDSPFGSGTDSPTHVGRTSP